MVYLALSANGEVSDGTSARKLLSVRGILLHSGMFPGCTTIASRIFYIGFIRANNQNILSISFLFYNTSRVDEKYPDILLCSFGWATFI
jgi:hypothetical protein